MLVGWLVGAINARFHTDLQCAFALPHHTHTLQSFVCAFLDFLAVAVVVGGVLYFVVWLGLMVDPLFVHTTNIMAQKRCLARFMIDEWFSRALNEILPALAWMCTSFSLSLCVCAVFLIWFITFFLSFDFRERMRASECTAHARTRAIKQAHTSVHVYLLDFYT